MPYKARKKVKYVATYQKMREREKDPTVDRSDLIQVIYLLGIPQLLYPHALKLG